MKIGEIKQTIMTQFEIRPVMSPSDIMALRKPGTSQREINYRRAVWQLIAEGKIEFTQERELRRVDQPPADEAEGGR